jgi:hypothetical protein
MDTAKPALTRARAASARRARIRELLVSKTQADQRPALRELHQLLGLDISLRSLKRDLQLLRGSVPRNRSVPKGPPPPRGTGSKRLAMRVNGVMATTTTKDLEQRLALVERSVLVMLDFVERIPELFAQDLELLRITNQARDQSDADRIEFERWRDIYLQQQSPKPHEAIN